MKKGFTLVELLVVIGMLAILVGSIGSGVSQARKRSMIVRATADAKEITNAILAYENWNKERSLASVAKGEQEATEGNLGFILGDGGTGASGDPIPVLYNGAVRNGAVRDPWGTPYRFRIDKAGSVSVNDSVARGAMEAAYHIPNLYRNTEGLIRK